MSEENVEIVRNGLEALNAFNRDELSSEAAAELLDPQIEFHWHDQRAMPDEPQHLRGVSEFIRHGEQVRSALDDLIEEPLEFTEGPEDRVLTLVRLTGRGRESGVPVEIHFFYVF